MKSTMELYKLYPNDLALMPYKEAIELKLRSAKEHLQELIKVHYYAQNTKLINEVNKAIDFNRRLLEELE